MNPNSPAINRTQLERHYVHPNRWPVTQRHVLPWPIISVNHPDPPGAVLAEDPTRKQKPAWRERQLVLPFNQLTGGDFEIY